MERRKITLSPIVSILVSIQTRETSPLRSELILLCYCLYYHVILSCRYWSLPLDNKGNLRHPIGKQEVGISICPASSGLFDDLELFIHICVLAVYFLSILFPRLFGWEGKSLDYIFLYFPLCTDWCLNQIGTQLLLIKEKTDYIKFINKNFSWQYSKYI